MKKILIIAFVLVSALVLSISCRPGEKFKPNLSADWWLKPEDHKKAFMQSKALFTSGNGEIYRIAAIAVTKKGSIVCLADNRKNVKDIGVNGSDKIDIILRRSEDGGQTWSNPYHIPERASILTESHSDPVLFSCADGSLVALCASKGGFGQQTASSSGIAMSKSTDDGKTWSKWKEIGDSIGEQLKSKDNTISRFFVASGKSLTMKDGTLMCSLLLGGATMTAFTKIGVMQSKDNGNNWTVLTVINPGKKINEPKVIAELNDGSLLMSVRPDQAGDRIFYKSNNRGVSWQDVTSQMGKLKDTRVDAEGVVLTSIKDGYKKDRLIHINCDGNGTVNRKGLRVVISYDEGKTWNPSVSKYLEPSFACYSSIDKLPDGTLVSFAEESNPNNTKPPHGDQLGYTMMFRRFNVAWITDLQDTFDEDYYGINR
ncbi:sialidase family protein [uncultured Brachyspira sp.]|uniref:sialidase family protein n=1 Tax=uncultured Brachyspira sp. TaxID=221953 RepID=UPI0025FB2692|nr:sialidase family protein [uncultured Brachyspira sp.]